MLHKFPAPLHNLYILLNLEMFLLQKVLDYCEGLKWHKQLNSVTGVGFLTVCKNGISLQCSFWKL